jgi:hypothetical protein
LEGRKEAITQAVAAIPPEMTRRVRKKYRERLNQCIDIEGRHLSDVALNFKTNCVYYSRFKKKMLLSLIFISFPNRGVLSTAPSINMKICLSALGDFVKEIRNTSVIHILRLLSITKSLMHTELLDVTLRESQSFPGNEDTDEIYRSSWKPMPCASPKKKNISSLS